MSRLIDFGVVGDGVADDTAAIQHAVDQGTGVLSFPAGRFRVTKPIIFDLTKRGYSAIEGSGGTSQIIMAGPGPAFRIVGDHRGTATPASVKPHTWDKERFPTLSGFEVLGHHPEAVGIELRKTMQTTISRVLVRNCRFGIHLVERNRNFVLSDSHLYDNTEFGLFFDQCNLHQSIVHGNHISYNRKAGIKSLKGDVHNLQITGNDIEYNNNPGVDQSPNGEPTGAEIWFETPEGKISEVTIASNTIQATVQPGGANIRIWGGDQSPPIGAVLIAITGNVIGSQTRGIELQHARRVTISGNTIYNSIDLSLLAVHCSGMSMTGNTLVWRGQPDDPPGDGVRLDDCDNCVIDSLVTENLCAGSPDDGGGVTLVNCRDVAVANSQILDPKHRGIELEGCTRCRIVNNSVVDRRETPTMQQAIRVRGGGQHNVISQNLVGGAAQQSIGVDGDSAIIEGNFDV